MNFYFKLRILILNFEIQGSMNTRGVISVQVLKILYAVLFACKISRSFADYSSKILISNVDKFYSGVTMIIQKNRRVNFESKLNTFRNEITSRKHLSTSIKYRRFRKKYNSILCGVGKKLNFSRRVCRE